MMYDLTEILRKNAYPGRGVAIGGSADGKRIIIIYFIMGRSENSRNRVFRKTSDGIKTEAFDPDKLVNPDLVIYNPVRRYENFTIVTNGDQTDTIYKYLKEGSSFREALQTRTFEPDPPIFTPRVSGIVRPDGAYTLSILKTMDNGQTCCRYFFEYEKPLPGSGHFISTYQSDGNPPPSFGGEPLLIHVGNETGTFAKAVWDALDADNKVALYAREIDFETGAAEDLILNKYS